MPLANVQQAVILARQALQAGELDRAENLYRQVVDYYPNIPEARNELGIVLMRKGQCLYARDQFDAALEIQPNHLQATNNRGIALHQLGQFDQAIAAHEAAIRLAPDWPIPHINLALLLLLKGDYARGFAEHEWRLKMSGLSTRPQDFVQPKWDGTPLNGRRILLHPEQGFGDSIQFVRYVPNVIELGGKVVLSCPPELLNLFRQIPGVSQLVTHGDPLPAFDVHCSLLSLPHVLKTDQASVPNRIPYLQAESARTNRWAERIAAHGKCRKIGIAWAGSAAHGANDARSVPINLFLPLVALPDVTLSSLQKGIATPHFVDWTNELHEFADTADLIDHLDLIVTVDTAVAHLAGAMGKPVWLLLPFIPDWRWMLQRTDSPWYPTMRLFRQPKPNDWQTPIDQVLRELQTGKPMP